MHNIDVAFWDYEGYHTNMSMSKNQWTADDIIDMRL